MSNMESLKRNILCECEEDHVGLWSVIRDVEEFLPTRDEAVIRDQVVKLLHELLLANEIKAGFPTEAGEFRSLRAAPEKIVARIEEEWPVGRRPTIGEGLWFTRAKRNKAQTAVAAKVPREKVNPKTSRRQLRPAAG